MSLVTDSRVHSPSSDGFAAYLDAELDSDSSDVSPEQEAEDDEQEAEDESDSEYKRVKRQKVEEFESIEEHPGSTSDGSLEQNLEVTITKDTCTHPGVFRELCIRCGQKMEGGSGVAFGYIHKDLRLGSDEIARLRDTDLKNLLRHKKLYLVLDLDHTLLNSTRLLDITPEELYLKNQTDPLQGGLKGNLFMLNTMHMLTKLRPYVHTFLKEASKMFEMYIYTMGERSYALEMAKLLDPERVYFSSRVISQADCTQRHQKGLDVVLGQESAVLILDDTESVWQKHKDNLILMERYHFFASSCRQFGFNCKSLSELKSDESEPDGALATVLKVLQRIHSMFFDPELGDDFSGRDVRQVAAVPEDVGTAGALRAIAHHLTANDILVVSGDLVCDVSPGAVAAAHRRHGAAVTAMLCSVPVSGPLESGSSSGKDKTKKPGCCNIIGLDPTKQFLLYIATGPEIERDIRVQKSILRAVGQMEIRADLMDAHLYAFKRAVLQEVLDQKDAFQSLQQDVLPYLVRSQLRSELSLNGAPHTEENGHDKVVPGINQVMLSQLLAKTSTPSFHELYAMGPNGSAPVRRTHKCCVYIASQDKYCARLNSIQAFSDINRDVIGEASHLSGYSFSAQNNIIHPSAELGSKTTVGQNCMLGEGSQLGDKCSVKRSVIGRHCRIGSNVKVVNSVVMNHVTISDGCSIQGSVICSNAQLQERVVLKDCQVGAGFVVTSGSEYKGEFLAKKER